MLKILRYCFSLIYNTGKIAITLKITFYNIRKFGGNVEIQKNLNLINSNVSMCNKSYTVIYRV